MDTPRTEDRHGEAVDRDNLNTVNSTRSLKPNTKTARVLTALLNGGTYNRFEAAQQLHDHCIHSTAARLQSLGLTIDRHDEVVRGFQGAKTHVMRYWLPESERGRALKLLGVSS